MLFATGIGLLNPILLWGLVAVAIPLWLHLKRRRPNEIVDWGATMFLDESTDDSRRRAFPIDERLLLAARMAILAVLAIALARPFWANSQAPVSKKEPVANAGMPKHGRLFVLVVDCSASMEYRGGGGVPRSLALRWARRFVSALGPNESTALIVSGARTQSRIEPATRDQKMLLNALMDLEPKDRKATASAGGPSDLVSALDDALRIVAESPAAAADILVLTDGQRFAWRPEESLRWDLVRQHHQRLGNDAPRVWGITFGGPNRGPMAVPLELSVSPSPAMVGRPFTVTAQVFNTSAESVTARGRLLIDGRAAGSETTTGTIPPRGSGSLNFSATLAGPGIRPLTVELEEADAIPGDNFSEGLVEVIERVPVLLVDGKPGTEPFSGQTDFLRVALDPSDAPGSTFRARVVAASRFNAGDLDSAEGKPRVLVLADVAELNPETAGAIGRFVESGGGLLVLAGDAARSSFYASQEWFPGRLSENVDTAATGIDLASFTGTILGRFASTGSTSSTSSEAGPLARVEVSRHRGIDVAPKATVLAKLRIGKSWCVERAYGRGRVIVLTTALDARGTTLPVNPDFVPLVHELALSLARGASAANMRPLEAGESWDVPLEPAPPPEVKTVPLRMPGGGTIELPVKREGVGASAVASVRVLDTDAPGVYRLGRERPLYAIVARDPREADPASLTEADQRRLSADWPLSFAPGDTALVDTIRTSAALDPGASNPENRFEFWRVLILVALAGLCLEAWLARRLVAR